MARRTWRRNSIRICLPSSIYPPIDKSVYSSVHILHAKQISRRDLLKSTASAKSLYQKYSRNFLTKKEKVFGNPQHVPSLTAFVLFLLLRSSRVKSFCFFFTFSGLHQNVGMRLIRFAVTFIRASGCCILRVCVRMANPHRLQSSYTHRVNVTSKWRLHSPTHTKRYRLLGSHQFWISRRSVWCIKIAIKSVRLALIFLYLRNVDKDD